MIDHDKTTVERVVVNETTGETKEVVRHALRKIDSVHAPVYRNRDL